MSRTIIVPVIYCFCLLFFLNVHASGFLSCYVAEYECDWQQSARMNHGLLLTCTTKRAKACFPSFDDEHFSSYFKHKKPASQDQDQRQAPVIPQLRSISELRVIADLAQIPSMALQKLPRLRTLRVESRSGYPPSLSSAFARIDQQNNNRLQQQPNPTLSNIDFQHDAFEGAQDLRELTFRGFDFSSSKPTSNNNNPIQLALSKANALRQLAFVGCRFGQIDRRTFGAIDLSNLTIQSCTLTGISHDAFDDYSTLLERLVIQDTSLTTFPVAIRSLRALKVLILSNCDLRSLPDDAFGTTQEKSWLKNSILEELDLSMNRFEQISPGAFRSLIDLRHLNLAGNSPLRSLPPGLFAENNRLESLDLNENYRLRSLTGDHFIGLENRLTRLSVKNCRNLHSLQVANISRLRDLNAQNCALENLSRGMFSRNQRFTDGQLLISDNPLITIDQGVFQGVELPREWQLQGTQLKQLDLSALLDGAGSLRRLELKSNLLLTNLSVSDLNKIPSTLSVLKLASNGDFRLNDPQRQLSRLIREKSMKLILQDALLCNCQWSWMLAIRGQVDFQNGGIYDNDNTDKPYCCNLISSSSSSSKTLNQTLVKRLSAQMFLDSFDQYCGNRSVPIKANSLGSSCVNSSCEHLGSAVAFVYVLILAKLFSI